MTSEELALAIGRIEAQGVSTHDMIERHLDDDDRVHGDHEKRIRSSERKIYLAMGGIALVSALGTWGMFV